MRRNHLADAAWLGFGGDMDEARTRVAAEQPRASAARVIRVAADQAKNAGLLKAYAGDVDHDVKGLAGYSGAFLWSVRDTGTHLMKLEGSPFSDAEVRETTEVWGTIATGGYSSGEHVFLFSILEWPYQMFRMRPFMLHGWFTYNMTGHADEVRDVIEACRTGSCLPGR